MTRCACTSILVSVLGPEVMLNKYNLEFSKSLCAFVVMAKLSVLLLDASPQIYPKSKFEGDGLWLRMYVIPKKRARRGQQDSFYSLLGPL